MVFGLISPFGRNSVQNGKARRYPPGLFLLVYLYCSGTGGNCTPSTSLVLPAFRLKDGIERNQGVLISTRFRWMSQLPGYSSPKPE